MESSQPNAPKYGEFYQYYYAALVSVGSLAIGTVIAWATSSMKYLQSPSSPAHVQTKSESYWLVISTPLGAIFGAISSIFAANQVGLRRTLQIFTIPWILAWLIITFSPMIILLHITRFVSGIIVGLFCGIIILYINDISEASIRGTLGSFFPLFMTIGVLFSYYLGTFYSYFLLCFASVIISVIFLLITIYIPESPIFLIKSGLLEEAQHALERIKPGYNTEQEISLIQEQLDGSQTTADTKTLMILCVIMVIQQFSGITAIMFYAEPIFEIAKEPSPGFSIVICAFIQCISTAISSFFVDRIGRRTLLLISSSILVFILLAFGYYYRLSEKGKDLTDLNWLPPMCLISFVAFFSIGLGPIPWLLCGEIFSLNFKSIGIGIAVAVNWLCVCLVIILFKPVKENWGSSINYWIFAGVTLVGVVFIYIFLPETNGKTMTDDQNESRNISESN